MAEPLRHTGTWSESLSLSGPKTTVSAPLTSSSLSARGASLEQDGEAVVLASNTTTPLPPGAHRPSH